MRLRATRTGQSRASVGGLLPLVRDSYLHPGFTFSRASTATYLDASGSLLLAGVNVPRWEAGRLLIEGARTNLFTDSDDLTDPSWVPGVGGFFTHSVSPIASRNPGATARKFVCATPDVLWLRKLDLSLSGAGTFAFSVDVYVPTQTGITNWTIGIDLDDTELGPTFTSALFDRWVRARVVLITTAPRGMWCDFNLAVNNGVDLPPVGFEFHASLPQCEGATFPSSYIPTPPSSTTTRGIDALSGLLSGLSLPSTGFTLYGRCVLPFAPATGTFPVLVSANAGTDNNAYAVWSAASRGVFLKRVTAGAAAQTGASGLLTADTPFGWAMAVNAATGAASFCMEGGTVVSVTGGPTSLSNLNIGGAVGPNIEIFGGINAFAKTYVVADADLPALAAGAP